MASKLGIGRGGINYLAGTGIMRNLAKGLEKKWCLMKEGSNDTARSVRERNFMKTSMW
jgi:hypothetical protein